MWVTTTKRMYSIVKYDGDATHFIVRGRVKGDIEAMWPKARVVAWPERDNAYRTAYRAGMSSRRWKKPSKP